MSLKHPECERLVVHQKLIVANDRPVSSAFLSSRTVSVEKRIFYLEPIVFISATKIVAFQVELFHVWLRVVIFGWLCTRC